MEKYFQALFNFHELVTCELLVSCHDNMLNTFIKFYICCCGDYRFEFIDIIISAVQ